MKTSIYIEATASGLLLSLSLPGGYSKEQFFQGYTRRAAVAAFKAAVMGELKAYKEKHGLDFLAA